MNHKVWFPIGWSMMACVFVAMPAHAARLALVVGNSSYADSPLKNPVNDARAMDAKLKSLGFEVTKVENLKRRDIGRTINGFASSVKPGDEVVVFYAGHGLQVKGANYLPVVDAEIQSEEDVPLNSLNLGSLLERLDEAKAGVKILFLDACRNNPYARSFRSSARGLARVQDAPSGTLMHFATRPGSVAADGSGANGLYTTELLRHIDQPGMAVEQMLKRVATAVERESKGQQEPWVEGSLRGDFYFRQGGAGGQQVASVVPEAVPLTPRPVQSGGTWLEDLKREEAARREWAQWQVRMKSEFDQVAGFNGSPDLQVKAWERFLGTWGQDNPLSNDDESLRSLALNRMAGLKPAQPRISAAPPVSSTMVASNSEPLRGVSLVAPDIAENGSVVPVGVLIESGLRSGQVLQIYVGEDMAATVQTQDGVLKEFQTRVIFPRSQIVSVRQNGSILASKQVSITRGGVPFSSPSFTGNPMRIRASRDGMVRILADAESLKGGVTKMTSDTLRVSVENTAFTSQNPFYGFKSERPLQGEVCIAISAAGKSRTDCAQVQ